MLLNWSVVERAFADAGDDVRAFVRAAARPSARIVPADDGPPTAQLGGLPSLPDGVEWPRWDGMPLDFLASVDCAAAHDVAEGLLLPPDGTLLAFVAGDLMGPRGELLGSMQPATRPGWRLLHVPRGTPMSPRQLPEPTGDAWGEHPFGEVRPRIYARMDCGLAHELTLPDMWEAGMPELWSDDAVAEAMEHLDLAGWTGPFHRVGGWPQPTQSAPALPAALAEAGLVDDGSVDHRDPRVPALAATVNDDFGLVLQLDSDSRLGFIWGDAGVVFFHGRPERIRDGDVETAWMGWDCH